MQTKSEINLLPVDAKEKRQQLVLAYRWKYMYMITLVGLTIIIVAYASAYGMFYWIKEGIQRTLIQQIQSQESTSSEIQEINQLLQPLEKRVADKTFWAGRINDITAAVKNNARLVALEYNPVSNTLLVEGKAISRTEVVAIEEAIKKISWVKSVDAPLQNFAQQREVEFSFIVHPL